MTDFEVENIDKKNNGPRKLLLLVPVFILIAIAVFLGMFHVRQTTKYFSYELGQPVSENLNDYISGMKWAVNLSSLDLSQVRANEVGSYQGEIKHGPFQTFSYVIEIADTTPPSVEVISDTIPIQRQAQYDVNKFLLSYSDLSNEVSFSFANNDGNIYIDKDADVIWGKECGLSQLEIEARDPSGNTTKVVASVYVDDPPDIEGNEDYYLALGSDTDFLTNVTAYDDYDGDIEAVDYKINGDYKTTAGEYLITYSATDSFGFTGRCQSSLHVMEALELQELINSHEIEGLSQYVVGAINPYDMGISVNNSIDEVLEMVEPSIVHIRTDYPGGGYVHGSGFILSVLEDRVIICTNKHVVEERDSMDVYFYNGERIAGEVIGGTSVPDIAFMSVNLVDMSPRLLESIKTVHLNTAYFEALENSPDVEIMIRSNYQDGKAWRVDTGKIERKSGVLSQYFAGFDYPVTEVTVNLIGGMSGSAIIDETGSLICMAAFKWYNGSYTEYYGVKVTDIVAYYKEIFGRDVDYYTAE